MSKVNTFIIGAQKAGTTSLYQWLGQHPDVYAPGEIKDYHFFTNESLFKKGYSHFKSFYNKNDVKIKLHAAVNYLYFYKTAAKRLYEYNPKAKIIVCLRNPVERIISAYKYFVRTGREDCSFEKAITRELKGKVPDEKLSDQTYLGHGEYLEQIKGYLEYFNKNQLYILLFEELINEKKRPSLMYNLFNYLDLDNPSFQVHFTHQNKSGKVKSKFMNRVFRDNYSLKGVKNIIPLSVRKKIGRTLKEYNISDNEVEIDLTENRLMFLHEYFKMSIQELEVFCNRDLLKIWNY